MRVWLPVLVGGFAAALYAVTMQRAYYDDGIRFEGMLESGDLAYIHILYLPVVAGLRELLAFADVSSEQALKFVSVLSGGFTVGMVCRLALDTLVHPGKALAVALLLSGLLGFWFHSTATELHAFHAAFATCLLVGLIRVVHAPDRVTPGLCLLLFFGAAMTPASHASGVATALPIALTFFFARGARVRLLVVIGAGFAVWAAAYWYFYELFEGYSLAQSDKLPRLLQNPGLLPGQLRAVASELLLYSTPASTLIPAGFVVLRQKVPRQAMLCLTWILGWAILALPVGDRAYGSNFIATMPAQALFAIVALHGLGTSPARMLLVSALAFLPAPAFLCLGELEALYAYVGSAVVLLWMVRPAVPNPRWPFLLHLGTFGLSLWFLMPLIQRDPVRDQIRAVEAAVGADATVLFLEKMPNDHTLWVRYFPGVQGPDRRAFNPYVVDYVELAEVAPILKTYRQALAAGVAGKGKVFLVEQAGAGARVLRYPAPLTKFLADVQRDYTKHPSGVPGMFELKKRVP